MEYNSLSISAARTPPQGLEAERGVLGAMLRSSDAVMLAQESLKEDDFYDPIHRELFSAALYLTTHARPVDIVTMDEEMSRRGRIEAIGGTAYLIELSRSVPAAANIGAYIRIVDEKSTLRKLIAASDEIAKMCYSGEQETSEVLALAEKSIYDITMRKGGEQLQPIGPLLISTYEMIEHLVKTRGQIEGVPSGYTDLDNMTTGFHAGELILIAARPSVGKTSFGMNIVANASVRAGKCAAVFSLEMPAEQLVMRLLCTEAKVDMQRVRRGLIEDDEWLALSDGMVKLSPCKLFIDATGGITVPEIRSKARRLQMENGLDIIMIDYLQLMTGVGKFGSRQEEVASISRSLKQLAGELGVPVIALSQLSRAPTGRSNHRPILSDIRDSGAIEQDADVVMFIHREDYYEENEANKGLAEIIIAKQRNGALGTCNLGFRGEHTWFYDLNAKAKEAIAQ